MTLRWHYAHGKFSEALGAMAVAGGTFVDRLTSAYLGHLVFLQLSDFPPELHDRISKLEEELSTEEPIWKGEGRVSATIRKMHPTRKKK